MNLNTILNRRAGFSISQLPTQAVFTPRGDAVAAALPNREAAARTAVA